MGRPGSKPVGHQVGTEGWLVSVTVGMAVRLWHASVGSLLYIARNSLHSTKLCMMYWQGSQCTNRGPPGTAHSAVLQYSALPGKQGHAQ